MSHATYSPERRKAYYEERKLRDPDYLKKESERVSAGRRSKKRTPEGMERERVRKMEQKRAQRAKARLERITSPSLPGPSVQAPKPKPKPMMVPALVRSAWAKGAPNSIIRRKYPTLRALQGAADAGEWGRWGDGL